jgi:ribonuclease HI
MSEKILAQLETLISLVQQQPALQEKQCREIEASLDAIQQSLNQENSYPEIKTDQPIRIWSDGACTGNPGPGGWGTIVEVDNQRFELYGSLKKTTNNIMEMTGALEGIKKTPEGSSIILTSDSQYLVKGMNTWMASWKKRGWKKADGNVVLNKELWQDLDHESKKRDIKWLWVKGHAGHSENERCDELARLAISH